MAVLNNTGIRMGASGAGAGGATGYQVANSLRFNSDDSTDLSWTPSAGDRNTWTFSCWVKRAGLGTNDSIFEVNGAAVVATNLQLIFHNGDYISVDYGGDFYLKTDALYRDSSAFYSIVLAVDTNQATDTNRMKLYVNGSQVTDFDQTNYPSRYDDLAINSAAEHFIGGVSSSYFDGLISDVNFVDGLQLDHTSFAEEDEDTGQWVPKEYTGSYGTNGFHLKFDNTSDLGEDSSGNDNDWTATNLIGSITSLPCVEFDGTGDFLSLASSTDFGLVEGDWTVECYAYITGTNGTGRLWYLEGNASNIDGVYFSDTNMSMGTTGVWSVGDGTGADYAQNKWIHVAVCHDSTNMRMYIDGVQSLTTTNNFYNASSKTLTLMSTDNGSFSGLGEGFISNFRVIKGTALYTSDFTIPATPLTNVTNTKLLCCQSDSSATTDNSDSSHTITANGDAAATTKSDDATTLDLLADSPSTYDDEGNGVGNYCTLNPLDKYSGLTLSNGNLNLDHSSGGSIPCCRSTIGMSSGKWYFEVTRGSGTYGTMGICTADTDLYYYAGRDANAVGGYEIYTENDSKWAGGDGGTSGYLTEDWDTDGDVASCYFDADNGTIGFMVNGTDMGTAYSGIDTTKTYFFQCGSEGTELDANFGQRAFAYTPPTGYKALNTFNLDPLIDDPSAHFNVKLYDGDDATSNPITELGFSPDFVWIKNRDQDEVHVLKDTVRGVESALYSNSDSAEDTGSTYSDRFPSFDADGFTVGSTHTGTNSDGDEFVAWCWNAGSSNTSVSAGDLNSSVYDQSETWSDEATISSGGAASGKPLTNGFDGSTSTLFEGDTTGATVTIPVSATISAGGVRVYAGVTSSTPMVVLIKNGVTTEETITSSTGWWHASSSYAGAITSLVISRTSRAPEFKAVEVNGKILTDDNVTPPSVPSIASTYRANPTAGFSIVSYTGDDGSSATVGHGLNAEIGMFMVKNREAAGDDWIVYHKALGATKRLKLNEYDDADTDSSQFNDTEPTTSVFTVGSYQNINDDYDYIAYCWSEVEGYSKFGSYAGNDSADGTYIYLGFKPALLIIKKTNANDGWMMYDNKREPTNLNDNRLQADSSDDEYEGSVIGLDFLSNGFKLRTADDDTNDGDYIYCAWAETPFKYSNAK